MFRIEEKKIKASKKYGNFFFNLYKKVFDIAPRVIYSIQNQMDNKFKSTIDFIFPFGYKAQIKDYGPDLDKKLDK